MDGASGSLLMSARVDNVGAFHRFAREGVADAGFSEDDLGRLDLILEELLVNVALHAYPNGGAGNVEVGFKVLGEGLAEFSLADRGEPFNPLEVTAPVLDRPLEDREIGGLGVLIVRQLCKSMSYERAGGRNRLTFEFERRV